jgi:hypothetical protein
MEEFVKENVEFEMPENVRSWKQNSKVNVQGNTATKTVSRVCKLKDNTEKVLTKTTNKVFVV